MSDILPLTFEGQAVRMTMRDGEPWFVLTDVCRAIQHSNPSVAARRLDDDEKMTLNLTEGHEGQRGGAQFQTIISESGLYSLVLTGRTPAAKRFRKWATGEVIPAIRKTGGYMVAAPEETSEELIARALNVLQAAIERQKAPLDAHDKVIDGTAISLD